MSDATRLLISVGSHTSCVVKRERLYVKCQNIKMSLCTAIGCHRQNVKWENMKMPNVRCQMWKYQTSNVKREILYVKCQKMKMSYVRRRAATDSHGTSHTSCDQMSKVKYFTSNVKIEMSLRSAIACRSQNVKCQMWKCKNFEETPDVCRLYCIL